MNSTFSKTQDGTITLNITIAWSDVKKTKEEVVSEAIKNADLPGFRKGKAPRKLVEEKLDETKVREDVLKKLLPKTYVSAIQKHNLRPIINPHIHILKIEPEKDWEFQAVTCEVPEVKLEDYKKKVQDITAKAKIIVPGKEPQEPKFDELMQALVSQVSIQIPKVLIDQEVEKLLAQMLDEVKKLGLSLDQYLSATKKTPELLREEYAKKGEGDIKLEFALQKIAESEKITVSEEEVNEAIQKAKTGQERKNLEANRYLLASILRQQKTLDFIKSL